MLWLGTSLELGFLLLQAFYVILSKSLRLQMDEADLSIPEATDISYQNAASATSDPVAKQIHL